MKRWNRWPRGRAADERGQSLVIFAMSIIALLGMVGLAVDVGRMYVAKAELTRAADAGALAGVQQLPDLSKAVNDAVAYVSLNDPGASATASQVSGERKLKVTASKTVPMLFMGLLGRESVTVRASATAGFAGVLDVALALDTTYSMSGQPIVDARNAANTMVGMLLPDASGQTKVGMTPYRSGFSTPCTSQTSYSFLQNCQPTSNVVNLTTNNSTLTSKISSLTASGYTNICMGVWQAKNILNGSGNRKSDPQVYRVLVLLTDGDNNPHERAFAKWDAACDPGGDSGRDGASCQDYDSREANLDVKTYNMAQSLKAEGVEIYVIGLSICGTPNSATCNTSIIGQGHDNTNDRNLLRCIASSTAGTNDHYYETANSSELTSIFQRIGGSIITRLVE